MKRAFVTGPGRVLILLLILTLAVGAGLPLSGCRPQLVIGDPGGDPGGDSGGGDGDNGEGDDPPEPPPPSTIACPLCGEQVTEEAGLHRPLAVVIDNHPTSRPLSGINDACLVYEVLVEGGLTRFVAFFLHKDAAAVGPVRSLRHYMLDLTMPLGAVVTHVGGSPRAVQDVADLKPASRSIDSMSYGPAFWYADTRRPPHNTYTSTSFMRAASWNKGYEGKQLSLPTPSAFSFAADAESVSLPSGSQSASRFTLTYPAPGEYKITYDYDTASGQWMRYLGGSAHIDAATGRQLRATTVIIQYVSSSVIAGDTEGRITVAMTGEGEAKIFTMGRRIDARWSKADRSSPIVYKDSKGNTLTLPPGSVWVLIAPPSSRLD